MSDDLRGRCKVAIMNWEAYEDKEAFLLFVQSERDAAYRKGQEDQVVAGVAALKKLYLQYKRENSQPMDFGRQDSLQAIRALPIKETEHD